MIRRVAKAAVAVMFGHGVNIAGNLLLVPLFLSVWSPSLYGEWLTLSSAVAYLGTLDLGLQTYAVNRLTQAFRARDLTHYRELQHTALQYYTILAVTGIAVAVTLACILPLPHVLNLTLTSRWEAAVIVALLAAQVLASLPANFMSSIYQTTGDLAKSEWIYQLQRAGLLGVLGIALLFRPRMAVLAAAQLVPILTTIALVALDVRRRFSELRFGVALAKRELVPLLLGPSLLFGLIGAAQVLTLQGATLVIAAALGSASVALFIVSRTLANLARQFLGMMSSSTSTEFTLLEAGGNQQGLRLAFRTLLAVGGCGCIAIAASLWFEGSSVIALWTGGKLVADVVVLRALLAQVVLGIPWIAASTLPVTSNRHRSFTISYVVASLLGIAFAFLGVGHFGLVAVPVGLIAGEALACYHFVLRDACQIIGEDYRATAPRVWLSLAITALIAGLVAWQVKQVTLSWSALPRWLASGLSTSVVSAILGWTVWLSDDERRSLYSRIGARLRRTRVAR